MNKMKTFDEGHYERVHKAKRSRLYKDMLDQQIRDKQELREGRHKQKSNRLYTVRHPLIQHNSLDSDFEVKLPSSPVYARDLGHLPLIQDYRKNDPYNFNAPRHQNRLDHVYDSSAQDQKTDVYLNNCEQIIHRLREIKNAKTRKAMLHQRQLYLAPLHHYSEPTIQPQKVSFFEPLYPRRSYFTPLCQVTPDKRVSPASEKNKDIKNRPKKKITRKSLQQQNQVEQQKKPIKKARKIKQIKMHNHSSPGSNNGLSDFEQLQSPKGILIRKEQPNPEKADQQLDQNSPEQKPEHAAPATNAKNEELVVCLKQLISFLKEQADRKNQAIDPPSEETPLLQIPSQQEKEEPPIEDKPSLEFQAAALQRESKLKNAVLQQLKKANIKGTALREKMDIFHLRRSNKKLEHLDQSQGGGSNGKYRDQKSTELVKSMKDIINSRQENSQEVVKYLKEIINLLKDSNPQSKAAKDEPKQEVVSVVEPTKEAKEPIKEPIQEVIQPSQQQQDTHEVESQAIQSPVDKAESVQLNEQEALKQSEEQQAADESKMKFAILSRLKKAKLRGTMFIDKIERFRKKATNRQEPKLQPVAEAEANTLHQPLSQQNKLHP